MDKWEEGPFSWIDITNNYNWLDYLWKDIPKKWTELFIISKLLEKWIKEQMNMKCMINDKYFHNISCSNEYIYQEIIKYNKTLESSFKILNLCLSNFQKISQTLKEKYSDFQEPIDFNKIWFNTEEEKKKLIFYNIRNKRSEKKKLSYVL